MFDVNSFIIDRTLRGTMMSNTDGSVLWSINQIENPSLTVTTDSMDAVDALGVPITTFERAKSAEFSGSNSLFDLGLLAAQSGSAKKNATAQASISVSYSQEFTWGNGTDVILDYTPVGATGAEIPYIYALNGDGTLGTRYECAAAAAPGKFKVDAATKTVTPPTDVTAAQKAWCVYTYEADGATDHGAVQVVNSAKDFPTTGKFLMEVLGCTTCDTATKYRAMLEFPQAKLMSDVELAFTTDGKHPFTIKAMQDYCGSDKVLFKITVPEV